VPKTYDVFISHSSEDKAIAEKIAQHLSFRGLQVWYDDWEILVGHDIVDKVYGGIRDSRFLLVLLSEKSVRSKWVQQEINVARIREIESGATVVLPAVIEPNAKSQIPESLRTKRYADISANFQSAMREIEKAVSVTKLTPVSVTPPVYRTTSAYETALAETVTRPTNGTTFRLQSIALVPIGQVQSESIAVLQKRLPAKFKGASCQVLGVEIDAEKSRDARSSQYHATKILADLEKDAKRLQADRLLGVTDLDLYEPGMNFVFGNALFPGRAAIISTCRLKDTTSYGGAELLPVRVVKESVHELGHTLSLAHCKDPSCVMYFSSSLRDTDRKGEDYCRSCSRQLGGQDA